MHSLCTDLSAASTHAIIVAELFGKYLLAEYEYTEFNSSSGSLVFMKAQSVLSIPPVLRSFVIPTSSAPVERVFSHGGLVLRPNSARANVTFLSVEFYLYPTVSTALVHSVKPKLTE